jgi:hypothetical protein
MTAHRAARLIAGAIFLLVLTTISADAGTFGADPVAVSAGARAPSGRASISGDNRSVRYVAFHSSDPSLVRGDRNGTIDVFVYHRLGGGIARASVSSSGKQANGPSVNPALDGSIQKAPCCVAFQSQATNLAAGDRDASWDIYVHDLRTHKTRLVSKGIGPSAVDPAVSGDCRQVAFTAAGRIYVVNAVHPGKSRFVARGTNPDLSLDGSAITWERGHGVLAAPRRPHDARRRDRRQPARLRRRSIAAVGRGLRHAVSADPR